MTSSACEHVGRCARSRVEYFRCEMGELIDEALAVDFVEDAASVVVPNSTHGTRRTIVTRGGSRKKYFWGLAPHHLGGNNG